MTDRTPQPSEQPTRWHRYDGDHDCWAAGCDLAAPDPVASPRVTAEHLEAAIGKALYGWGDDEPNEATGWTTRTEVKRVVLAVIETLSGDPRLAPVASPAPLDRELVKKALSVCGVYDPTYTEMFAAEYARLEGPPVAEEPDDG